MKLNIDTSINFGGFYHSIHDSNIDNLIESYSDNGNYPEYNYDNINYQKTFNNYIKDYCNNLESYFLNVYKLDVKFNDIYLDSPKYYNFKTDVINCKIDNNQVKIVNKYFKKHNEFLDYLKNKTVSFDGYISYYTYEQAINDKDNILINYILEFICNEFNKDYDNLPNEFEIEIKEGV